MKIGIFLSFNWNFSPCYWSWDTIPLMLSRILRSTLSSWNRPMGKNKTQHEWPCRLNSAGQTCNKYLHFKLKRELRVKQQKVALGSILWNFTGQYFSPHIHLSPIVQKFNSSKMTLKNMSLLSNCLILMNNYTTLKAM